MSTTSLCIQFPFNSLDEVLASHFKDNDLIKKYNEKISEWKKQIQRQYENTEKQDNKNQVIY